PLDPNNIDAQIAAAGQARYPEVRDSLYDRAVELALMDNDYGKALMLANKIGGASLGSAAVSRVRQAVVSSNIQKKDFNAAYSYCSQAPNYERASLLMSIARAAAATDGPKAKQLLAEAMQLVDSFDESSFKSSQRLTAISAASDVDTELGFGAMKLAVDQINRTGYGVMGQNITAPGNSGSTSTQQRMAYTVTMISFDAVFRRLAQ